MNYVQVMLLGLGVATSLSGVELKKIRSDFDFFKPLADFNKDAAEGDLKDAFDKATWNPFTWVSNPFGKNYFYPLPVYGALYWALHEELSSSALDSAFWRMYRLKEENKKADLNNFNIKGVRHFVPTGSLLWLYGSEDQAGKKRVNRFLNLVARKLLTICLKKGSEVPSSFLPQKCPLIVGKEGAFVEVYGFDFSAYGYQPFTEPSTQELLDIIDDPRLLLNKSLEEHLTESLFGASEVTLEAVGEKFKDKLPGLVNELFKEAYDPSITEKTRKKKLKTLSRFAELFKNKGGTGSDASLLGASIEKSLGVFEELFGDKDEATSLSSFLDDPGTFLGESEEEEKRLHFEGDPVAAINKERERFEKMVFEEKTKLPELLREQTDVVGSFIHSIVDAYLILNKERFEREKGKRRLKEEEQKVLETKDQETSLNFLAAAFDQLTKKLELDEKNQ